MFWSLSAPSNTKAPTPYLLNRYPIHLHGSQKGRVLALASHCMASLAWHFVYLNLSVLIPPSKNYKTVQMTNSLRHYPVVFAAESRNLVILFTFFLSTICQQLSKQFLLPNQARLNIWVLSVNFHKQLYKILNKCPKIHFTLTINFYSLMNLIFTNYILMYLSFYLPYRSACNWSPCLVWSQTCFPA